MENENLDNKQLPLYRTKDGNIVPESCHDLIVALDRDLAKALGYVSAVPPPYGGGARYSKAA